MAISISRLLAASASLSVFWVAVENGRDLAPVAAAAFAAAALGFLFWQRASPSQNTRAMMEVGLYGGAILVISVAAVAGGRGSPFLLFLIWLVPWAFIVWERRRALTYVAVLAVACGVLLRIQQHGGFVAFLRSDVPLLVVEIGGLVAIGLAIRLVVDRLMDAQETARGAGQWQALAARLARMAIEDAGGDGSLATEAARIVRGALRADRAEVVPTGAPAGGSPHELRLPISADSDDGVLVVGRSVGRFAGEEVAFATSIADVLAVAARRVRVERQRRELAGHDELTGLPGRELFVEQLAEAVAGSDGREGVVVLVLDIDDFVLVNETLGPSAGDALLIDVGRRLRHSLGPDATIGRVGADEFAVLTVSSASELLGVELAKRVQSVLQPPFQLGVASHHVTATIGVATCDPAGDPRGALRDAHLGQRRAREQGRGRYEVFDASLRRRLERRRSHEQELRRALDDREFRLVYQPIIELGTGRVHAAEALLRWEHPERGRISPGEFIEVAEATDLIIPIGAWVLRQGLRQLKAWEQSGPDFSDFRLAVNVSGRQLADGRFVPLLRGQLAKYDLDPSRVTCELTETALTGESPHVDAAVSEIKELGVGLALDDFGTGYASLRYLQRFAFDSLKLDRSFVSGLGRNADDTALVAAAISLGDALGMNVIAEGVETEQQADRLRSMGCSFAQGFLFARPTTASGLRTLLKKQRRREALGKRDSVAESAAGGDHAHGRPLSGGAVHVEPAAERFYSLSR